MKKALRIVDCCASCEFVEDNVSPGMQCEENGACFEDIAAYCICDLFQRHLEIKDICDISMPHEEETGACDFFHEHRLGTIRTYSYGHLGEFTVEELYQAFRKRLLGEVKQELNDRKAE